MSITTDTAAAGGDEPAERGAVTQQPVGPQLGPQVGRIPEQPTADTAADALRRTAPPGSGTQPAGPPPPPLDGDGRGVRPIRLLGRPRLENYAMLIALGVMASADAVGFWIILEEIMQGYATQVMIVVAALAVGTIAIAHQTGRLTRSRRAGYGGSLTWIGVLTLIWLCLGGVTFWIRMVAPPVDGGADVHNQLEIALLFLAIYLMTGALAMTHAYRNGDPIAAEVREARRLRRRQVIEHARSEYEQRLADGLLAVSREDLDRERAQHSRERDDNPVITGLQTDARHGVAEHLADPSATDALADSLRPPGAGPDPMP